MQNNTNTEKITFKVVQIKLYITDHKLNLDIFTVGN